MSIMRKVTAAAAGSLFLVGAVGGPASAAPLVQNGLVNVTIEDNTVTVPVNVAASLAVTACDVLDVNVNQVAVLARAVAVDRSGQDQTICSTEAGDVTISNDIVNN